MSVSEVTPESTAWDEEAAREWAALDRAKSTNTLEYPWKLAATIAGVDRPVTRVLDVASGPGGFLGAVLDESPGSSGIWFDFSQAMKEAATENLARFGDRVEFQLGDMTVLSALGGQGSFDLVTTSRATHHLLIGDLAKFYQAAFDRLKSGGWIANIDNMPLDQAWGQRLRAVRAKINGPKERNGAGHAHPNPYPSRDDHLAALRVAGFETPQLVWSSLLSGLLMARKP